MGRVNEDLPGRVAGITGIALGLVLVGTIGCGVVFATTSQSPHSAPTPQASERTPNSDPDRVSDQTPPGTDLVESTDQQGETDGASETSSAETIYLVKKGDTLTALSACFDVSVDAIAKRNDIADIDLIITGSKLVIPGQAS